MTISLELKPCPFCGGNDLSNEPWAVMPDDYHASIVVCADCELEGPSSLTLPEPDGCWTGDEASAIELGVKAWNRRAQAAPEAEPVTWREHSVNYAKGEKCPETIETLQAAWARDQELIDDMRHEIARHKTRINRLEQRRGQRHDAAMKVKP